MSVVMAWTVWLLILALILCGNATSPSLTALQIKEVFRNLKVGAPRARQGTISEATSATSTLTVRLHLFVRRQQHFACMAADAF
jgi:hypothetical protein